MKGRKNSHKKNVATLILGRAEYTAFMYLESDIRVPWLALLGWAADEPVLAQLGFQRAFYRVEPIEQTGQLGLTDQVERVDISTYARTVHTRAQLANGTIEVCAAQN